MLTGLAQAKENVWSRSARRKRKRVNDGDDMAKSDTSGRDTAMKDADQGEESDDAEEDQVALAVKIHVKDGGVDVRWLRGLDAVVFESFCGMLKRAVREGPRA